MNLDPIAPDVPRSLSGSEKVAALLLVMGKPLASRLLGHFDAGELKVITRSAAALGMEDLYRPGIGSPHLKAGRPTAGRAAVMANVRRYFDGRLGHDAAGTARPVWLPAT